MLIGVSCATVSRFVAVTMTSGMSLADSAPRVFDVISRPIAIDGSSNLCTGASKVRGSEARWEFEVLGANRCRSDRYGSPPYSREYPVDRRWLVLIFVKSKRRS